MASPGNRLPDGAAPSIRCSGNYADWDEALRSSTGYYLPQFVERTRDAALRVRRGEAAYERDSVLFQETQHSFPLLAGLLRAALEFDGILSVFDFGGGFGTSYFQCRAFLKPLRRVRWLILDQEPHVRIGRKEFESDELRFFFTTDEVMLHEPNVLVLSGVLSCVPEPYELMSMLLTKRIAYVIVDRTFFLQRDADRLTVQHGPLEIYPGSYPAWFLSETRFVSLITRAGYTLIAAFDGFDSVAPEDEPAHTRGFIFRCIDSGTAG